MHLWVGGGGFSFVVFIVFVNFLNFFVVVVFNCLYSVRFLSEILVLKVCMLCVWRVLTSMYAFMGWTVARVFFVVF